MTIKTERNDFISRLTSYKKICVVQDERFEPEKWRSWVPREAQIVGLKTLVGGEGIKSVEHAESLWNHFAACGVDRSTLVLAVGGGSITDLAGFAASTYKRGVDIAFLPTTIIAMVDAAIGGKNGVNFRGIKNQIGTYHLPVAIGIDAGWLDTLPAQEQVSGWMEMLKHGMIAGEAEATQVLGVRDLAQVPGLLAASAAVKARIVREDPRETGRRKSLNLGHTVGHALEALSHAEGNPVPHGIAVGFGLGFTLLASVELGAGLSPAAADSGLACLKHWLKHTPLPHAPAAALWELMQHDKKNAGGEVLEVWLREWGQPIWDQPLKFEDFQRLWLKTIATFAD